MTRQCQTQLLALLTFAFSPYCPAYGGWLASTSLGWEAFSFRPHGAEETPNYYGLGPEAVLGYSFEQAFDLGGYAVYTPGTYGSARLGREDASLFYYGGQASLRLFKQIFCGLRAGRSLYHLLTAAAQDPAHSGKWQGPAGSMILGSLQEIDKRHYWQISLEVMTAVLSRGTNRRKLDALRLSIAYTFNDFESRLIAKSFF